MKAAYLGIPRSEVSRAIRMVAQIAGIPEATLLHRKDPVAARWRWLTMALFRRAGHSYPQIGAAFGRDHSSVIGGTKNIEQKDPKLVDDVAKMVGLRSVASFDDRPLPSMAEAVAAASPPLHDVLQLRQAAGDAVGGVMAAMSDVYQRGDVAAWRRLEQAAERLTMVARSAREGAE